MVLEIGLEAAEGEMSGVGILVEVVGNVVVDGELLENSFVRMQKDLFVHHWGLSGEAGSSLLGVLLLDRDNVCAGDAADIWPESLKLSANREPRNRRRGGKVDSCDGIALAELHGVIDVGVGSEAVEGHDRQGAVADVDIQSQRLARLVPVFVDGTL